ncbi:hypothetical protein DdX_05637 [Ditylenchus destructor]|uniref:Uncharacterized protein n=1 Tax=Ditylenchus destructor TaxID=166010 RepID=A0AAD4R9U2_9BILA|nr:hypothetical protein DdX_05637 [Ditylenchus destructor]
MNAWKIHFGDMFSDDEEDDDVIVLENPQQETSTKPSSSKPAEVNPASKRYATSKEEPKSPKTTSGTIQLDSRTESLPKTNKSCGKEYAPSADVAISAMALFKRVEAKIKTLAEDPSTMLDSEILDQVAEKVVEILKIAYQNPDQPLSSLVDKFVSTPGERYKKLMIKDHVKDLIHNIIQERKCSAAKLTIDDNDPVPQTLSATPSSSPELSRIHSSPLDHSVGFLQGERISLKYCPIPMWNRMVKANPNESSVRTFSTIRGKQHTPDSKFKPMDTTPDKSEAEDDDVQIIETLSINEVGETKRKPTRQNAFSTSTSFTTSTRTIEQAECSSAKHNCAEISSNKTTENVSPIEARNLSPLLDVSADLPEVPIDQDEPLVCEESVVSDMDISKDPEHIYVTDDAVKHFIEHKLSISLLPAEKVNSQLTEVISISTDDLSSSSEISSTSESTVNENQMDIDAPQQSKSLHTSYEVTPENAKPTSFQEQTSQEKEPVDKRHVASNSGTTELSSLPGMSRWDEILQEDPRANETFPEFIPIGKKVSIKSPTSRSKKKISKSNLSKSAKVIISTPVMNKFSEGLREIFQKYTGTPSDEFMSDTESEASVVAEESKKPQSTEQISASQMMNVREGTSRAGFPCKKRKVVTEDDEIVILSTKHTAQQSSDDVKIEPVSEIQMDLDAHLERQQNVPPSQKQNDDFRKVFAKVSQRSQATANEKTKSKKRKKSKVKFSKRSDYEVEQKDKMEAAAKRFRSCLKGSALAAGRKHNVKVSFSEEAPKKKFYIIPQGNTLEPINGEEQTQQQGL